MLKRKLSLPAIRKTVTSFLLEEEGKISKESVLKLGVVVGGVSVMAGVANATHSQNIAHSQAISVSYSSPTITATHSHYDPAHASHASHSSHTSHTSHSSHSSHASHASHVSHVSHIVCYEFV